MSENDDIRRLLQSWPYDPDNDARLAHGADGRPILQVRTPLGIEQYEMQGRPDGQRPHDRESALEYQLARLADAERAGGAGSFALDPAECAELINEGTLYYYRYLRFFQLKHWHFTIRDTDRNLRLFDFIHRHGQRREDREYLEKWRPYILRMNAIAKAMVLLEARRYADALEILQSGIKKLEALADLDDDTFAFERQRSLVALTQLAAEIAKHKPLSEVERLERELAQAVAAEQFERAAELRDRLKELRKDSH